jgi:hypothetical protein
MSITITLEDGQLQMQPAGQPKVRLHAEAQDAFFPRVVNALITFTRDGNGQVTGLVIHQAGSELSARKVK